MTYYDIEKVEIITDSQDHYVLTAVLEGHTLYFEEEQKNIQRGFGFLTFVTGDNRFDNAERFKIHIPKGSSVNYENGITTVTSRDWDFTGVIDDPRLIKIWNDLENKNIPLKEGEIPLPMKE